MTNNDIFNIIIYNVMVQISKKFPDNVSFNIDDILPFDFCNDDKKRGTFCYNTLLWLEINNYIIIQTKEIGANWWGNVVPTDKLLAVMNTTFKHNDRVSTFMNFFQNNAIKGAGAAIQEIVSKLLLSGAKIFGVMIDSC